MLKFLRSLGSNFLISFSAIGLLTTGAAAFGAEDPIEVKIRDSAVQQSRADAKSSPKTVAAAKDARTEGRASASSAGSPSKGVSTAHAGKERLKEKNKRREERRHPRPHH